jgi:hypothetical protein
MNSIIQEASITGLLRLILIIVIVYAVYSFFIRFIIPSMMRKYVSDFQQRFTNENQRSQEEANRKKEGEVSITYVDKDQKPSPGPDNGEYVDYEEIK